MREPHKWLNTTQIKVSYGTALKVHISITNKIGHIIMREHYIYTLLNASPASMDCN